MRMIEAIDTHTGGEPTRIVTSGGPDLGTGTLRERLDWLRTQDDWLRTSLILEPRGCDWMVGALIQPPTKPECVAGVIFFNNVGYLGMCGHGMMGVAEALRYSGRISAGVHRFETPVGDVSVTLHNDNSVSIANVESFRYRSNVTVEVPYVGEVVGDVAYGGNWFFLIPVSELDPSDIIGMTTHCQIIRASLARNGITGIDGAEIDHIELCGPLSSERLNCQTCPQGGRNFVLCPGGEYDRSPCGTGTSAKIACLAADGELLPGDIWHQESIIGSLFKARFETTTDRGVMPIVTGRAHVTGEVKFVLDADDAFQFGIPRK